MSTLPRTLARAAAATFAASALALGAMAGAAHASTVEQERIAPVAPTKVEQEGVRPTGQVGILRVEQE